MTGTGLITSLALTLGVGFCSGINLYATVAVLGLMHRYVDGFQLPGDMAVLSSNWVVWPALLMYVIEFIADKVPAVDTAWDGFHTFIRVPAGAVLAAMALGDVPLEVQVFAGLIGGTLAMGTHLTKAGTRLAAHATGTSPIVSPIVSVAEDVLVVGTISLVATHPVLSLFLLAGLIIATYFLLKTVWTLARRTLQAIRGFFARRFPSTASA